MLQNLTCVWVTLSDGSFETWESTIILWNFNAKSLVLHNEITCMHVHGDDPTEVSGRRRGLAIRPNGIWTLKVKGIQTRLWSSQPKGVYHLDNEHMNGYLRIINDFEPHVTHKWGTYRELVLFQGFLLLSEIVK